MEGFWTQSQRANLTGLRCGLIWANCEGRNNDIMKWFSSFNFSFLNMFFIGSLRISYNEFPFCSSSQVHFPSLCTQWGGIMSAPAPFSFQSASPICGAHMSWMCGLPLEYSGPISADPSPSSHT